MKSSTANPATTAVAGQGLGASGAGFSPTNGGTSAGGAGLGVQPFYGLESFPLSEKLTAQVNLSTGNLVLHAKDVALSAPGLSVNVDRFYNGLSTGTGSVGAKTVLSTGRDVGLQFTTTGATFYGPSGFTAAFLRNPDGVTFAPPAGVNADLIQGGTIPGGWQLTYRKTGEKLEFNSFGFLMADLDRNGTGLSFTYNADPGLSLAAITDAAGRVTDFTYGASGLMSTVADPGGRVTVYVYDTAGRLIRSTRAGAASTYTYDGAGRLSGVQAPGGNWASFAYDAGGRVISVSRYTTAGSSTGVAATTGFAYAAGSPGGTATTTETNPLGKDTHYSLDSLGRVTKVIDPLGRLRSVEWTANSDVSKAVDAMGTASALANETKYTYDQATNNLTSVELPSGAAARAAYGAQGGPTCGSNGSGTAYQAQCVLDAQGNQTQVAYDGNGNMFTTNDSTPGGVGGARSVFREFPGPFDAHCGGKIGQVCFTRSAYGVDTKYAYNANGDVVTVTPPAPLGVITYAYDSLSRVTAVTDGKGQTTTYTYDTGDHLLSSHYADGTVLTASYDQDGQKLSQTDTTGANSTYTYDTLGRQTSTTVPGATPNVISVTYDQVGNVTSYTDKAGTIGYSYDAANELVALTEPGGSCSSTPGTKCTRFIYNANGARTSTIYPGGTEQKAELDKSGRPLTLKVTGPGNQVLSDLAYNYTYTQAPSPARPADDRSVVQSRTTNVDPAGVIAPGSRTTYAYNSHGNLTNATETLPGGGVNAAWGYAYDQSGNRTHTTSIVPGGQAFDTEYQYNGADQVINRNYWPFDWAHDPNGNQTNVPGTGAIPGAAGTPANATTLNTRDQVTATNSNGVVTPYSYAGASNNNRLTAGGTSYQSGVLGQASQTTSGATTAFTRTPGGSLVSMRTSTGSVYYLTDNQGSIIGLVNGNGQKVAGYAYTPYGETRATTGPGAAANPYRYTSGYLDTTSNLYKLGHRYYDPRQGRFTQQDPSSQETNAYLYAGGDPINGTDPTGLSFLGIDCPFGNVNGGGSPCRGSSALHSAGAGVTSAVGALGGLASGCTEGALYGTLFPGADLTGTSELGGCLVGATVEGFGGAIAGGLGRSIAH